MLHCRIVVSLCCCIVALPVQCIVICSEVLDVRTEVALPSAKAFDTSALKAEPIFVWYDYFSCPQLEHLVKEFESGQMSDLAKAIRCSNFVSRVINSLCFIVLSLTYVKSLSMDQPGPWQRSHSQPGREQHPALCGRVFFLLRAVPRVGVRRRLEVVGPQQLGVARMVPH